MAYVNIPGVGLVDNVTGKIVNKNSAGGVNPAIPKPPQPQQQPKTQTIPGVGQYNPATGQIVNGGYVAPNVSKTTSPTTTATTNTQTTSNTSGIPAPPTMATNYTSDNYGYINKVYDTKAQNQYNAFKNAYTNTLNTLSEEQSKINPAYEAEKQKATSQSELQRLNFSDYLKSRGVSAGGQLQSEISRQSALGNTVGTLQSNRQSALDSVGKRKTEAATTFNQAWSNYMGTNALDKAQALQAEKQAQAKAAADAAAAKAKQDREDAQAAAKAQAAADAAAAKAQATLAAAQTKANATITAAQIKAQQAADKAAADAQKKADEAKAKESAKAKDPTNVDKTIQNTFNIGTDKNKQVIVKESDKPGIGKVILTSQMTPQQQYNMLKKYGIASLGPINIKRYVQNVLGSGMSEKEKMGYLAKFGVKTKEDVDRILGN